MIERPPLLATEPRGTIVSLEALVGLANAIEVEAVARYAQLAAAMDARGEAATAAVFRTMQAFEERHVDSVARLAERLRQTVPPAERYTWLLPAEMTESWETVQHSALLTPYRALSIAVVNEQRAFALYSYVAARAGDDTVARQAEALAREELAHAAELRVRRRQAYRREFPGRKAATPAAVETLADFEALDRRLARQGAAALNAIGRALNTAGDPDSARIVFTLARREEQAAACSEPLPTGVEGRAAATPLALLGEAVRRLEGASEIYEEVVDRAAQEDLLQAAQAALERVVGAISTLGRRLDSLAGGGA